MRNLIENHGCELMKGAVGVMASTLSVLTSFQENVEHFMRVGALAMGMLVSTATTISIVRGWNKKKR